MIDDDIMITQDLRFETIQKCTKNLENKRKRATLARSGISVFSIPTLYKNKTNQNNVRNQNKTLAQKKINVSFWFLLTLARSGISALSIPNFCTGETNLLWL